MDALSDVLQTIKLSGMIFLRGDLGAQYGVSMPPPTISHPTVKPHSAEHRLVMFHIVREGQGYVEVEGFEAQQLHAGDLIIIFDDLDHNLVDAPGRDAIPSSKLVGNRSLPTVPPAVQLGKGPPTMRIVCGMLQFVDRGFNPLFKALPPFLHVPGERGPPAAWIRTSVDLILTEAEADRPGGGTFMSRLTELLFVETLRGYLKSLAGTDEGGWFSALNDSVVGPALQLMHESPAHPWTVAELAKRTATSRSGFAARFGELLGVSPIAYLTQWRIRLATNLLEDPTLTIADIAGRVGYESESAFHRAFKREIGLPPASWRRQSAAAGATPEA
ncbi:MAG: AraC family transcriptional regulator [Myxococcota bacterium]